MAGSTGISRQASQSFRSHPESLAELFVARLDHLGQFEPVGEQQLPADYATLLAHRGHMTVTLEAYHESLVRVQVVAERSGDTWYARQSLLGRHSDGAVVQYGIMRIDLQGLPTAVRTAIETHAAPLGRILIRNNLLREVEPLALWKITMAEGLAQPLGGEVGQVIYGRSAAIHLAGEPAVDLLEIVTDRPVRPPIPA